MGKNDLKPTWLDYMGEKMDTDIGSLRAKFLKAYSSVPEKLRDDVIAIINDKPYSWNASYVEILAKTALGDSIITKLEEVGLFKED